MIEIDETEYIYSGYCNVKKKRMNRKTSVKFVSRFVRFSMAGPDDDPAIYG
jgi:hypothetical protein